MSYQVLARKWRPHRFDEMVGQGHVLRALINALDSDRLHHAYLFTGTRGVGKTSLARVFAKALNCEVGVSSTPCGECANCREVDEGRCVDLIEVDAASRTKVDETRELLDNVQYAPTRARYKVYLIDEVHMFSTHSFNALLKTLEEPPPHVKFLLATTDPKKLPVTVLSRCLQFNLKRITVDQLTTHLAMIVKAEGVSADDESLALIAHAADGSVRDSLSLLDQAIAYGNGELRQPEVAAMLGTIGSADVAAIVALLSADDGAGLIALARELAESAPDYHHVLGELLSLVRRIAVYQSLGEQASTLDESEDVIDLAENLSAQECQLFYQIGLIGRRDLALAPDPQSGFEMVLLRMLAFRPANLESEPRPRDIQPRTVSGSPSKQPAAKRREQVANSATRQKSRAAPTPSNTSPRAVLTAQAAAVDELAVDAEAPVAAEINSSASPGTGELDWNELVSRLKLDGFVRELARNAALKSFEDGVVELLLAPQHENLRAERLVQGFESALREQLHSEVRIRLSIEGQQALDTPSRRMSEVEEQRQQEAERNINDDPTIKSLLDQFGATIEKVVPQ